MNPFRKYQNTLKWILSWLKKKAAFMSALVITSVREISTTPFLFLLWHNNMPSCWFQQMLYGASESIWKWFLHVCVCVWREKELKIGQNTFIETELYMQPVHLKIILSWYSWGESCTVIKLAPVNFSVVQQQDRAFQLKWPRVHCEDDAEECEVLFFQSHLSHKETCMLYIFQVYL